MGYGNMLSSLEMWHGSSMSHSKASLPFILLEAVAFIAWMKGLTSAKQVKADDPEQFLLQNRRSVRFGGGRQQIIEHAMHCPVFSDVLRELVVVQGILDLASLQR